jgi:hypothetical protein
LEKHYSTSELAAAFPRLFNVSTLKKSRMNALNIDGPPFIPLGRKIVYDHEEVMAWLRAARSRRAASAGVPVKAPSVPPARGRPTKVVQIKRRQAV